MSDEASGQLGLPKAAKWKGAAKSVLLIALGALLSKLVDFPTERMLEAMYLKAPKLSLGIRTDPLAADDAERLEFLLKQKSPPYWVLTLHADPSGTGFTDVKVLIDFDQPLLAHALPLGFALRDRHGNIITENLRHFANERMVDFTISDIPAHSVFEAYFVIPDKTKFNVYCAYNGAFVAKSEWTANVPAPTRVLPIEYKGIGS